MRTKLINLDRVPEHLTRMQAVLGAAGVEFERFPAIDGAALPRAKLDRIKEESREIGGLLDGEIGCFLSHQACWREAASSGEPMVIMEDDIHIGTDARTILGSSDWVPPDADVVKLDTSNIRIWTDRKPAGRVADRSLLRLRSWHGGTGAYVVLPRGAATLLKLSEKIPVQVDQFMFNPDYPAANSLVTYQLVPAICVQDVIVTGTAPSSSLMYQRGFAEAASAQPGNRERYPRRTPMQTITRVAAKFGISVTRRVEKYHAEIFHGRTVMRLRFK